MSARDRWSGILVLGMGILAFCGTARADESAVYGVGGVLKPMRGHPSVRMVSEEVHIKLPEDEVEASFTFHNDGPPVTVLVGFPEQGKGRDYTQFTHFRSALDGKPIKVTRYVQARAENEDDYYQYWWIKRVHFDRGQTRVILSRYEGGEYAQIGGILGFNYTLSTGSSWKGPIGRARIICDIRGLHNNAPLIISPSGYRREGDTVVWERRNFKPKEDDDIDIEWIDGFLDVEVNGDPVIEKDKSEKLPMWTEQEPIPFKQGNDVWVSVHAVADWLDARLTIIRRGRTLRLTRGGRWAEVTVGSSWLRTARGRVTMPRKAYRKERKMLVALRSLVMALGGKAAFNKQGRLIVHL